MCSLNPCGNQPGDFISVKVSHAYTGLVHVFEMKGCYEEALQCLHKSRVVLSQCYEDKGKFLPHQVRRGFEILEDKFTKVRIHTSWKDIAASFCIVRT